MERQVTTVINKNKSQDDGSSDDASTSDSSASDEGNANINAESASNASAESEAIASSVADVSVRALYASDLDARIIRRGGILPESQDVAGRRHANHEHNRPRRTSFVRSTPKVTRSRAPEQSGLYERHISYFLRGDSAAAEVRVAGWADFQRLYVDQRQHLVAITILAGEPGRTTESSTPNWSPGQESCADTTTTAYTSAKYDGHDVLPERICIGSTILASILNRITIGLEPHRSQFKAVPVTLLRPYRTLTYYNEEIRNEYSKLVAAEATQRVTLSDEETEGAGDQSGTESESDVLHNHPTPDLNNYDYTKKKMDHMACLIHFMDDYIARRTAWLKSASCERIFFSDIWHIYKPGDIVLTPDGKKAYRVARTYPGKHMGDNYTPRFPKRGAKPRRSGSGKMEVGEVDNITNAVITCFLIDYDGESLSYVSTFSRVEKFEGQKLIDSLPYIPLRSFRTPELTRTLAGLEDNCDARKTLIDDHLATLRQRLVQRGRRFVDVLGSAHMYYSGPTADKGNDVEGQVVIDMQQARVESAVDSRNLPTFFDVRSMSPDYDNRNCSFWCCSGQYVHSDTYLEVARFESYVRGIMGGPIGSAGAVKDIAPAIEQPGILFPSNISKFKEELGSLRDTDFMIMHNRVYGYVLRDHKWEKLDMDFATYIGNHGQEGVSLDNRGVSDERASIHYDSDDDGNSGIGKLAFSSLVLPRGHKRMILSLVSQHFRNKMAQKGQNVRVDVVHGKGKGLVILLHGAPGVGKTTTAEGVAEMFDKPLLQITCGDLGNDAREVERSLQMSFLKASRWGAILLLDEADVFLAARGRNDFTRNGLVAVLEYYTGILFLTTNRIGDIDEAFTSRIHMILYYPHLDELTTVKICRLNLDMIQERFGIAGRKIKIDKDEVEEHIRDYWRSHGHARWNGRQIRNACQTAVALAEYDAQPSDKKFDLAVQADAKVHLKVDHVQRVSEAYLKFHNYLKDVHGTSTNTRAKELGLRAMDMQGEESLEGATYRRRGRARQQGRGRYSEGDSNPLDGFLLPTAVHASDKQHPQPQYQQPQQPYQYQHQPQQSVYLQQYQQQQSGSQPAMHQPFGQFPPTSHASMSTHGQPPIESSAVTVASFATSANYVSAPGSMQVLPANPYAQPLVQPMTQQPTQNTSHSLPYSGQGPPSNWNMTSSPACLPAQSSHMSGPNLPDQPSGPPQ